MWNKLAAVNFVNVKHLRVAATLLIRYYQSEDHTDDK